MFSKKNVKFRKFLVELSPVTDPYERFKALLEKDLEFPAIYLHKFIGSNTDEFRQSVLEFEKNFTDLTKSGEKLSASQVHVSFTYEYLAKNAEEIVQLTIATKAIPGVLYIL